MVGVVNVGSAHDSEGSALGTPDGACDKIPSAIAASIRTRVGQIKKAQELPTANSWLHIEIACDKLLALATDIEGGECAPFRHRLRRLAAALEHSAVHDKPEDRRNAMFRVVRALYEISNNQGEA